MHISRTARTIIDTVTRRATSNRTPQATRAARRARAKIAANNKELAEIQEKLKELAKTEIMKSLKVAAMAAPIDKTMTAIEASQMVQGFLIGHQAIPVHKTVCSLLVDKLELNPEMITYGNLNGYECGFIPGLPLLKIVGFVHEDAPTLEEMSMLESIDENSTRH